MSATREVGEQIRGILSSEGARAGMDEPPPVDQATVLAASRPTLERHRGPGPGEAAQVQSIAAAAVQQSAASEQITRTIGAGGPDLGRTGQDMASTLQPCRTHRSTWRSGPLNTSSPSSAAAKVQEIKAAGDLARDPLPGPGRKDAALRRAARRTTAGCSNYLTDRSGGSPRHPRSPRPESRTTPRPSAATGRAGPVHRRRQTRTWSSPTSTTPRPRTSPASRVLALLVRRGNFLGVLAAE
jgi:hypothetical protein